METLLETGCRQHPAAPLFLDDKTGSNDALLRISDDLVIIFPGNHSNSPPTKTVQAAPAYCHPEAPSSGLLDDVCITLHGLESPDPGDQEPASQHLSRMSSCLPTTQGSHFDPTGASRVTRIKGPTKESRRGMRKWDLQLQKG
ncbi:hypothetical protein E2C01_024377 [Portunus trituberculatus]|uniref:Uncharacterized protein n=1 Tax=Portunus trituberculatus TaxID=210409 RepID=A0A5B7ECM2_PORTR|nr:hypothetical protein [Portunus trituberculatus]